MNRSNEEIQKILSAFRTPDRARYPELNGYSRDECYQDFFGGGGLYLAVEMSRTLRLKPHDIVLDLGCGKGATSIFLVKHYGVKVLALDLWTSAEFLNEKFKAQAYADRISGIKIKSYVVRLLRLKKQAYLFWQASSQTINASHSNDVSIRRRAMSSQWQPKRSMAI